MNVMDFIETWLNAEPKFNDDEFQNDVVKMLKYYSVKFDKKGYIINHDQYGLHNTKNTP